jgi:hypothetical protein
MLDAEMARLKQDLALLDRYHPDVHWTKTPIKNYSTLVSDVRRMWADQWWERPQNSAAAAINQILAQYESGRDGQEEPDENARARRQRAAEGHGAGKENVEADNAEKFGIDELVPDEDESINDWFGRIGKSVDANGHRKLLWAVLRSHAARFRGDAKAKTTLDKRLVRQFLKKALN